jgi:hypothetical protein
MVINLFVRVRQCDRHNFPIVALAALTVSFRRMYEANTRLRYLL